MRILLVDDEIEVIQALLAILKTIPGHEVRIATAGDKAIENAAELGGVDLLITDVVMDPMDGFTLRDHLQAQYPEMRTILISGYDLSEYPAQTQNHQLLAKPIDADVLRAAIAKEALSVATPEPAVEPPSVAEPAPAAEASPAVEEAPAAEVAPEPVNTPAPLPVAVTVTPVAVPATPVAVPIAAVAVSVSPVAVPVARPVAVPQPAVKVQAPVRAVAAPQAVAQPVAKVQPVAQPGAPRAVSPPTAVPVAKAAPAALPTAVAVPQARPIAQPAVSAGPPPVAVPQQPVASPEADAPRPTVKVGITQKAMAVPPPSVPRAVVGQPTSGVRPASPVAIPKPGVVAAGSQIQTVKAVAVPVAVSKTGQSGVPQAKTVSVPGVKATAISANVPTALPVPSALGGASESAGTYEGLAGQNIGAYQILRRVGAGRWGSIYAGLQVAINRPVGIEVLDADKGADPVAHSRFVADARAKAQVQHPSTLAVYEAGEAEGHTFYAFEYVDGHSLAELKANGKRLDEAAALKVMRVAADGLAYFGNHHIPHAPPEASSLYLGKDGQPRLGNLATQLADGQLEPPQEIQALGRIMLSVLPAIQTLSPGLRDLLKRLVQSGPEAMTSWGELLQGLKAIEPKVIPLEAAKISAQDRAAIAAVEQARKQQKRSLYMNIGSIVTLLALVGFLFWKFFVTNERTLTEQVVIPAGPFIFGNNEQKTLPEFSIDKYEVTYGQYAKFVEFLKGHPTTEYDHQLQPRMKAQAMHKPDNWEIYFGQARANGKARGIPIDLNCPVMEVDFWDAYAYAKWKGRELPTEQEWEKAARGTKGLIYPWGDQFDPKKVNSNADYDANNPSAKGKVDGFNFWNPVDAIKGDKSPFGVVGMAGNVREWTATWDDVKKHPIIKGGSFMSSDVRLDQRADADAGAVSEAVGFRTISHPSTEKK